MFNSPRLDTLDKRTVRNYFMNASLRYWQRSFSELIGNGSFEYVADRFLVGPGLDGVAGSQTTYSRSTDVPNADSSYSIQAQASYVPDEEFSFIQRVESIFTKDLSNGKVSLKFLYKTDGCDQVKIKLQEPNAVDDHSSSSTRYFQTFPITGDDTWRELLIEDIDIGNVNNGLQFHAVFISDTTGTVTTKFALPQLNKGSKIEDFTLFGRDIVEELWWCQRYFEKTYDVDTEVQTSTFTGAITGRGATASGANEFNVTVDFKTHKRAIPIMAAYAPDTTNAGVWRNASGGDNAVNLVSSSERSANWNAVNGGVANALFFGHWTADAEL